MIVNAFVGSLILGTNPANHHGTILEDVEKMLASHRVALEWFRKLGCSSNGRLNGFVEQGY